MSDRFAHRCTEKACPFIGQRTDRGCKCHRTREEVMLSHINELTEALSAFVEETEGTFPFASLPAAREALAKVKP